MKRRVSKLYLYHLLLLGALLVAGDFIFGLPVAWKITRIEPWVRTKDPVAHHGFRPMESQPEQYGPYRWMMYINSLGGKDASCREVPKVGDRPRVAVFGDSFAEGWGLPYEQSLPAHLQTNLGSGGIEVLGFGVASYCPSLTEKWMRKLLEQGVRWDLAVVLIDAGDFWEEMHDYKKFIDGKEKMKVSNKPRFFRLKWYEYSLTVQAVTALHRALFPKKQEFSDWEKGQRGNNWKLTWLDQPESRNWLEEGLQQSGQAVLRILQMGRAENFRVLLAVYPYPVMMARGRMDNEHTRFWKNFAKKNRVSLVDLSPCFVEPGVSPEETYGKYFIPGDFHWNDKGSRRVAEHLTPILLEKMKSAETRAPAN